MFISICCISNSNIFDTSLACKGILEVSVLYNTSNKYVKNM